MDLDEFDADRDAAVERLRRAQQTLISAQNARLLAEDLDAARALTGPSEFTRIGLFYHDREQPIYDELRRSRSYTAEEKLAELEKEFDRYAI